MKLNEDNAHSLRDIDSTPGSHQDHDATWMCKWSTVDRTFPGVFGNQVRHSRACRNKLAERRFLLWPAKPLDH